MTKIKKISAREILDSRGWPTVEATVFLADGSFGVASVPSGASTGKYEALELRDGDKKRFHGKGVLTAVKNIEKIEKKLIGFNVLNQQEIDKIMIALDGTDNKNKLGANAILAVSLACARAGANSLNMPLYKYLRQAYKLTENKWRLPIPTMNIINGGKHADNSLTVQEFMVVPAQRTMAERIRAGSEIFHCLKNLLKESGYQTLVGDEGGFAPNLKSNEQALDFIVKAIKISGYGSGIDTFCAVDLAMSEYFSFDKGYSLNDKLGKKFISANELIKTTQKWVKKYPIVSLEDPLAEDDWQSWRTITEKIGEKTILVGDDLFVTNVNRLKKGIENKTANAILIKLNQIGTLTETIEAIYLAKTNNYKISVSHRSGETADTFIADLAVAVNADFIKTGSLSRSERVEKYNRLLYIESELKNNK